MGGKLRFDNQVQETPIGEFSAYYVSSGREPEGTTQLTYTLTHAKADNPTLDSLVSYINGRFVPDEQTTMVALPEGARRPPKASRTGQALPLIHILIPFEFRVERPGEYESEVLLHLGKSRRRVRWDCVGPARLEGQADPWGSLSHQRSGERSSLASPQPA